MPESFGSWRQIGASSTMTWSPFLARREKSFCLVDLDLGSVVESVTAGPQVDLGIKDVLLTHLEIHLPAAELLILSGSLPPGLPDSTYAEMIRLAARYGIPVLADIHSEPLREAVPLRPWLLKPNLTEFHALIGYRTHDMRNASKPVMSFVKEQGSYWLSPWQNWVFCLLHRKNNGY